MLLAFDWQVPAIARALRISEPTLKKHYFRELRFADEARPSLEAELIATTIREAFSGSAAMMKQAMKLLERHDLARLGIALPGAGKSAGAKLGKKEAARLAAQSPSSDTTMGDLMRQRQALAAGGGKPN